MDTSKKVKIPERLPVGNTYKAFESTFIPTHFFLGGMKIEVVYDDSLVKTKNLIGEANYRTQKIVLDPSGGTTQMLEQTYLHELIHWIFFMMNEETLRNNEKLVDMFAHFLYQARITEQKQTTSVIESAVNASSQGE